MSLGTFTQVQDDGTALEMRRTINFKGCTIEDDSTNDRINVSLNAFDGDITIGANKNLTATAGTGAVDLSGMTGTFKTPTGAHTINGAVTFAADKGIAYTAGTGAADFSNGTGVFKTTTGAVTLGTGDITISGKIAGDVTLLKETNHSISVGATTSAATAGGNLTVMGGTGLTTGAGGDTTLGAGDGGNDAVGGALLAKGGAAGGGNRAGGSATLRGGVGSGTEAGGAAALTGGEAGATGAGGAANVTGGAGGATSGNGGAVAIAGGAATNGGSNGGAVTIAGGAKNGGGTDGVVTIGATNTARIDIGAASGPAFQFLGSSTGTGAVVERYGATATEGMELVIADVDVSPAAVETNVVNVPAGSVVLSVQGNVEAALTGGGTTVTWSIGTAGAPDKYGTAGYPTQADSLAKNSKSDWMGTWAYLTSAEQIVLTGAATGGAADGDTALTVGTVRVVVRYYTMNSLDDAP